MKASAISSRLQGPLLVFKKFLQRQIKARQRKADNVVKAAVDAFRENRAEVLNAVRASLVQGAAGIDIGSNFAGREPAKCDGGAFNTGHHALRGTVNEGEAGVNLMRTAGKHGEHLARMRRRGGFAEYLLIQHDGRICA